jgi:hypothetical protein
MHFLTNITGNPERVAKRIACYEAAERNTNNGVIVGDPLGTEFCSTEQMKAAGYRGLWIKEQTNLFAYWREVERMGGGFD